MAANFSARVVIISTFELINKFGEERSIAIGHESSIEIHLGNVLPFTAPW